MKLKTRYFIFYVLIFTLPGFAKAPKDLRVAIIGAGMSGLTAGHYLKKEGYRDITIFEKEEEIGGKILTKEMEGALYELGAVWVFPEYKTILEMVREFNIPLRRYPARKKVLTEQGSRIPFLDYGLQKYDLLEILGGVIRAKGVLEKYSYLKRPGFVGAPRDLFDSFDDFVKKNKLETIAHIVEPFIVGTGYGYSKDVPAMYYLKPTVLIFDSLLEDIINEKFGIPSNIFQFFPGGFLHFLKALARDLDVRTGEEVLKVKRSGSGIEVFTNRGVYQFDRLIISTPPDATLKFLDATEEEHFLFSQMESNYFQITAFKGRGLPRDEVLFLEKSTEEIYRGVPAVLANWGRRNNIWVALSPYDFSNGVISKEVLMDQVEEEVNLLGGVVENILFERGLSYFFHYSGDFLKSYSPYEKLESMQGNLGTYYIGGHLNFESVEHTAEYAREVVQKYLIK